MTDRLTVLIVEDDPLVRATGIRLLASLGHRVLDAWNGDTALSLLADHPEIDVLFADVRMAGMSGTALAKAARGLYPDLEVILTSGYVDETPLPDVAFVPKPWSADALAAALAGRPGMIGSP